MRKIVDGIYRPGDFLPSEIQLATDLGISVGTLRKATEDLVAQGLLERQHGRGTQIVAHTSDRSRFRFFRFSHPDGRPARMAASLIAQKVHNPTKEDQRRLALRKTDQVIVVTRLRSEDGVPLVYERISLPQHRFTKLHIEPGGDMLEELYVLYQKQCGEMVGSTVDEVQIDMSPVPVSTALGCKPGTPLLLVKRVALSLTKAPVEFRQSWTLSLGYLSHLE